MGNIHWLNEIFVMQLEMAKGLTPHLTLLFHLFLAWGWFFLPFFLWSIVKNQWLFWRNGIWDETSNPQILLEIRPPDEIVKPIRAMNVVIDGFWQLYGPPNWVEKWWHGQYDLGFSLEIAAIDGVPHFLIRVPAKQRSMFESHIYAQYPDAEIREVEDYTKNVPQNIPNERWQLWGTDYTMPKSDCYPLKTYREFETEAEATEEKKIDPIASLIEGLSSMEEGEQMWIQIKAKPVTEDNDDSGYHERAKKEYEKFAGRKEKDPPPTFFQEMLGILKGDVEKKEEEKMPVYTDMMLTPGEREVVEGIERKRKQQSFSCYVRYIYLAKKEKLKMGRIKIPMSYFNLFNTQQLGFMIPWTKTITKIKQNWWDFFWFLEKRLYVRKRDIFRNYARRIPPFYPREDKDATFILGSDELATLYHFPSRTTVPPSAIQRVESRKKEPPHDLPVEK